MNKRDPEPRNRHERRARAAIERRKPWQGCKPLRQLTQTLQKAWNRYVREVAP